MRSALLAVLFTTVLSAGLIGCSDDPDEPSPTATISATSAPVPTTVALTATAAPGRACPVDTTFCDFARTLLPILDSDNADALLRLAQPVEATCPSAGLGGPSPSLCAGAASGEKRAGYWDFQGGEGLIVPEADLRRTLERWFASIDTATGSDAWGPGELRIGSITCSRATGTASGQCDGQRVRFNFTFINSPQAPADRGTGIPGQRVTFFVEAGAIGSIKVRGFGTTVPPNSVLESLANDAVSDTGQRYLLEHYPWKP